MRKENGSATGLESGASAESQGSNTLGFKDFAQHIGVRPSYITQLRKDGRLVLTDNGKAVKVAESIALIEATRDPSKVAVAARHAAARGQESMTGHSSDDPTGDDTRAVTSAEDGYQRSRAVKERYNALSAKRDYELSIGRLLEASAVERAAFETVVDLRTRFESMSVVLGPQLAAITDEARCIATIDEYVQHALEEAASHFARLAKGKPS